MKKNIAVGARILTGRPELQGGARGRHRLSKIIDCDFERAEMTFCRPDLALRHRKIVDARGHDGCGRFDQNRDVEMILEQFAGVDSGLAAGADQEAAAALQFDKRRIWRRLGRRRKQCRHFRPGLRSLAGPSGGLADIGKLDRTRASSLRGYVGKQRRFLGARDRDWPVLCLNGPETSEFGTAQLVRIAQSPMPAPTDSLPAVGYPALTHSYQH